MLPLTIAEILQVTQGVLVRGNPSDRVGSEGVGGLESFDPGIGSKERFYKNGFNGVSIDSRTVCPGDIFFALKGEQTDGHHFINETIERGIALCLISQTPSNLVVPPNRSIALVKVNDVKKALANCSKYYRQKYGNQTQRITVCGSCGKTTVKEMLAQILVRFAPTVYSLGNFNNEIGCPLSVFSLRPDYTFAVFELGSSALGEVKRLAEIVEPHIAIITNIGLEHTATFGDIEKIVEGESEVLPLLSHSGCAVLPQDDVHYEFLRSRVPKDRGIEIRTFGFSKEASVFATDIKVGEGGTQFTLIHRDEEKKILNQFDCTIPMVGRLNILNACAAVSAAFFLKIPEKFILDGLRDFSGPQMRFQIRNLKNDITIVDDCYNANPASMRAALESFVESFANQKCSIVLGDMLELGEISKREHYSLGQFIARFSLSHIILFGQESQWIAEGAKDSSPKAKVMTYCSDEDSLQKAVHSILQPGNAIFFKASRGMRMDRFIQKLMEEN